MITENQRDQLRWRRKPLPELVRLAWPIMVSMLSYSVMTLVDTLFAGRLGAVALGAVGFGGVITFTLICFAVGVLQGSKVLVAQAVGASRHDRIPGYIGAAVVLAVGFGAFIALAGQLVALGLPALADDSAAVRVAQRYVAIRLLGTPMVLVAFAVREIRCALGDSRSPMRTALIANGFHIPLNATLIFGLHLGVTGAAISTVIAQSLEAALLVLVQRKDGLGLAAWTRRDVADLWHTGTPLGLERLFNVGSFSALVTLIARVGDRDLAAHQIANQVNLFAVLPMLAIAEASSVLAGQAVGANEDALVRRVARLGLVAALIFGALCAAVYVLVGTLIAGELTSDHDVQALAARLLRIAAGFQPFVALYVVGAATLRGAGDVRYATIAMATIAWVVTPPLAALLCFHFHLGAAGGWIALVCEWAVGGIVLYTRLERGRWLPHAKRARERLAEESADWDAARAPVSG
ncbi:MAG TPA: MATE family efflux transporter [Polyangiaceae bacterium]|jgi:MATE family multidrug resistance protein|nr:MATE family efflux transporter [Polyangiaceae bacterium]